MINGPFSRNAISACIYKQYLKCKIPEYKKFQFQNFHSQDLINDKFNSFKTTHYFDHKNKFLQFIPLISKNIHIYVTNLLKTLQIKMIKQFEINEIVKLSYSINWQKNYNILKQYLPLFNLQTAYFKRHQKKETHESQTLLDFRGEHALIQEDYFLRTIVPKIKRVNWGEVMEIMNQKFNNKQRTAKQCRERFINYSSFSNGLASFSDWKEDQIDTLYSQFERWGTRWTKIAHALPGKSENSIKNKFYGSLRKAIRKINDVGKNSQKKIKKKIRYQSIIRIIEAAECFQTLGAELKKQSLMLRQRILKIVREPDHQNSEKEISILIDDVNRFNLATRSYRGRKQRKFSDDQSGNADVNRQIIIKSQVGECRIVANSKKNKNCSENGTNVFSLGSVEQLKIGQVEKSQQTEQKSAKIEPKNSPQQINFKQMEIYSPKQQINHLDDYILGMFSNQYSPLSGNDLI